MTDVNLPREKIKFGDRVLILDGFYAGQRGIVWEETMYGVQGGIKYRVRLDREIFPNSQLDVWVLPTHLGHG